MLNRTPLVRRKALRRTRMPRRTGKVVAGMNRKDWDDRLDDLFRAVLMTTHGAVRMPYESGEGWFWYGRCLWCDRLATLYVSHIEPKGQYRRLRWTEVNAFPFCYHCHMHRWHKSPREAMAFRVAQLGLETSDELGHAARMSKRNRAPLDYRLIEVGLVHTLRRIAPRGIEGLEY